MSDLITLLLALAVVLALACTLYALMSRPR